MTTQEQRAEWRALEQAATPGEWFAERVQFKDTDAMCIENKNWRVATLYPPLENRAADAAFIAAARTAVPALLADVDALTQERDAAATALGDAVLEANRIARERDALKSDVYKWSEQAMQSELRGDKFRDAMHDAQARADALAAELARVRGDYEYIRQRAPWGAIQRLAWYGAENYNYSTDAKQVEEYVTEFHPNAQPQA